MDDTDVELTEFEEIQVESVKGVPAGANGFPHLIMKGLSASDTDAGATADTKRPFPDGTEQPAHMDLTGQHMHLHQAHGGPDANGDGLHQHVHSHSGDHDHDHSHDEGDDTGSAKALAVKAVVNGQIDQGPDVAVGQQIMHLLGQAIINEAQEISAGAYGETMDVSLLTRAADMVGRWCAGEQGGCGCCSDCTGPGCACCWDCPSLVAQSAYEADEVVKALREFTEAERKTHAAAGHALPDGSYPVPDADALRRAAILARSKHGNWQAAEKLIGRRAKELGVANPLDDNKDDAGKSTVAEGETDVHTDAQGTGGLAKAVEDAVTKATKPLSERIETLSAELAKVKATPLPGGPVLSNVRPQARTADGDDWAAKAALYRAKAEAATTPADRDGYRQLAREADEKAEKAQAAPA